MPAYSINFNIIIIPKVISYNLYFTRRAKLGQIQGGVAEGQPRFDKGGGVAIFFTFMR